MIITPHGQGHCVIRGQTLDFRLKISGLGAKELQAFLGGTGGRPDWIALAGDDGVGAELLTAEEADESAPLIVRELEDGRLETRSGGAGRVVARGEGLPPDRMLPQSLHLLLAQQWARDGILVVHAAAVNTLQGGILILGPRGAGKSTLTVSALAAGLGAVSDDWMLMGQSPRHDITVERLRGFLMLRRSWAAERLSEQCPDLRLVPFAKRPKQVMELPEDGARFPPTARIRSVWLLQRPRAARTEHSRLSPASAAFCLRRLVEASMPLLFSSEFEREHQALLATARHLIRSAPCRILEPGTDIVNDPAGAWQRLAPWAMAACAAG